MEEIERDSPILWDSETDESCGPLRLSEYSSDGDEIVSQTKQTLKSSLEDDESFEAENKYTIDIKEELPCSMMGNPPDAHQPIKSEFPDDSDYTSGLDSLTSDPLSTKIEVEEDELKEEVKEEPAGIIDAEDACGLPEREGDPKKSISLRSANGKIRSKRRSKEEDDSLSLWSPREKPVNGQNSIDRCKDNTPMCPFCKRMFSSVSNKNLHMKVYHSEDKPFVCVLCDATFKMRIHLDIHMRKHTGEKPFKCTSCEKCFAQPSHLRRHVLVHTGEKPHKCTLCNAAFAEKGKLTIHLRSHTGERPYSCHICQKRFIKKTHLDIHLSVHSKERPNKCEFCGKGFKQKTTLTVHRRIHTGERPYKCDYCDKTFTQSQYRLVHLRTHTKEKPFICQLCERSFAHERTLTLHYRTHTKEKPFECEICRKCFSLKQTLVNHFRIHTQEKPFVCDVCEKAFTTRSTMAKHRKRHNVPMDAIMFKEPTL